jgi:uncharacterized membrane protein
MKPPQFRLLTLMFVIWLSALLLAGVVDVLKELAIRNRVVVVDEHIDANGSTSASLIFGRRTYYFVGPIPLGPWPVALLSGVAFAASVAGWALCRRRKKRKA